MSNLYESAFGNPSERPNEFDSFGTFQNSPVQEAPIDTNTTYTQEDVAEEAFVESLERCKKELGWKNINPDKEALIYTFVTFFNRIKCLLNAPFVRIYKLPSKNTAKALLALFAIAMVEIMSTLAFIGACFSVMTAATSLTQLPELLKTALYYSVTPVDFFGFAIYIAKAIVSWIVFGITRFAGIELNKNPNEKAIHTACALVFVLLLIVLI